MSIISRNANQALELRRHITDDSFEGNTYQNTETIMARYEPDEGTVRTIGGDEVQSRSYVLTEAEVKLKDLIEGRRVVRIKPIIIKKGILIGYEVFLS